MHSKRNPYGRIRNERRRPECERTGARKSLHQIHRINVIPLSIAQHGALLFINTVSECERTNESGNRMKERARTI